MKNVKKNFIFNTVGSLINSSISLLFLVIVTRINGTDIAGIFTFAFSTACLLEVIAIYAGRTYQVTNLNKEITDSDFFYNKLFVSIVMFLVTMLFVLVKGYNFTKLIIIVLLAIYKMLDAIADYFHAIIQKKENLYQVGISLGVKGIFGVIAFLLTDIFTHNVIYSIIALIIVNLVILIFYDVKKASGLKITKFNWGPFKTILLGGLLVFIPTILNQYIINASKYAIDNVLSNSKQTIYGIILMPATVLLLCSQFIVQPFLTKITKLIEVKDYKNIKKLAFKMSMIILAFGGLAITCAYFLGIPVLELLYGISLKKYLYHLLIILAGSVCFGLTYLLMTILIAIRKNGIQVALFGITSIAAYFISTYFVKNYALMGASLAYAITMLLLYILYLITFLICFRGGIDE